MTEYVPGIHLYDMASRLREFDHTLAFRLDSQGFVCIVRRAPVLRSLGKVGGVSIFAVLETYHHIMRLTDLAGCPRPPDARDLHRLREIDTWGRANHLRKMDSRNAALQRSAERRMADLGYEMGKDMHWHLKKAGAIH